MNAWQYASYGLEASNDTALMIDRRAQVRSAPTSDIPSVWVDGDRRVPVEILDESEGGIAVLLPDVPFEFGPYVFMDINDTRRKATIVYLSEVAEGFRVGLQWA